MFFFFYCKNRNIWTENGTTGTKYHRGDEAQGQSLLCPDFALWDMKSVDANLMGLITIIYGATTLPEISFACEWEPEAGKRYKSRDKIVNYFLHQIFACRRNTIG